MSVQGRQINVGVKTFGADEVEWRLLFSDHEVATTTPTGELRTEIAFGTPQTEWVLIAILRRDGKPFSVWTIKVPPGNFAAG